MATFSAAADDENDGPAPKKQCVATGDAAFDLELDHSSAFRQLVDVVSGVLKHLEFTLTTHPSQPNTVVLSVDAIDPSHVCMVQSRIPCKGTLNCASIAFCVNNEVLMTCLRNVDRRNSIRLYQSQKSSSVRMESFDGLTRQTDIDFEIATLDDTAETMDMNDITFDYDINVNTSKMKSALKLAKDLHCESVTFEVYGSLDASEVEHRAFRVSGAGDATFNRTFPSAVQGNMDADDTVMDVSTMKRLFSDAFTLEYLLKFVKNMDQSSVNLKMKSDLPLLVHYGLGIPESYVRFLLCPKVG